MIDYIFSEHHKVGKKMQKKYRVGGKTSYADIHKMMEAGKLPKDYQGLAKDQEEDMRRKGKDQHGPRGAKYIKRRGGVKRKKAQGGISPEMQAALAAAGMNPALMNLNPELAAAAANAPQRNDRLTNMSEAEMRRNEAKQTKKETAENIEKIKDKTVEIAKATPGAIVNTARYIKDNPLDAAQVALGGIAGADFIPIAGNTVSAGADLLNAGISGYRSNGTERQEMRTKQISCYSCCFR